MKASGITVVGLNGCGKTTLGRALARSLEAYPMDVETYWFPPSDAVPFSVSRTEEEVRQLFLADMERHPRFVLSMVNGDWCREIETRLRCAVFLSAPVEVRLERIGQRERVRFGPRVLPGGDMYEQQRVFHEKATSRSEAPIEAWLRTAALPFLRLDACPPLETLVPRAVEYCRSLGL